MAVPLAALAIPAIIQGGIGIAQLAGGASMNPKRPDYEIPESAEAALANAKYVASQTGLPGADVFRSALKENMANSIFNLTQAATSPTQILEGVTKMNEEYANQEQNLAIQSAQNYLNNQGMLRGELNTMAAREDQKWVANEYNPWLMKMERKQALMEGGMHNIMGGVGSATSLLGAKAEMDFMKDFYGRTGTGNQPVGSSADAASSASPITRTLTAPPLTTPNQFNFNVPQQPSPTTPTPTPMPMPTPYINPMTAPQFNSDTPGTFGYNPFGKTTPLMTTVPSMPIKPIGSNFQPTNPFK